MDVSDFLCDRCGQPAIWRTRVVSACCVLGEPLCDSCESKSSHTQWWDRDDTFWEEVAGDAAWLAGKVATGLGKLKGLGKQGISDLKPADIDEEKPA